MRSIKYFMAMFIAISIANVLPAQQVIGPMQEGQERTTMQLDPETLVGHGFVLSVNGDALSSYEVIENSREKLLELAGRDYRGFYTAANSIIQSETMREVYDLLMYQYALQDLQKNDSGDQMLGTAREKYKKNIIRKYAGNQAIAYQELEKMGTSMEEMLDKYQRRLVISSYKDVSFSSDQTISRLEILDYYKNNIEKYTVDAELQFSLIQLGSKSKAEAVLGKLKDGEDFAEVAKAESEGWRAKYGGLWDAVEPDSIKAIYKPVIAELIKIQPGELTGIVESEGKYFIARQEKYSPTMAKALSEVQEDIRNEIYELRWKEYTDKLSKRLLDRAVIGDVDAFVAGTVYTAWKKIGSKGQSEQE